MGTTQQDAGYTSGMSQSGQGMGSAASVDRVGEYERIYDPTRIGGDNEASFVQGTEHEGETQQSELGPGMGDMNGSVPYNQVIGTYQEAASQAMRRTALPTTLQEWVQRYFSSLLE